MALDPGITTLEKFKKNVKNLARPNRFIVEINGPILRTISIPTNYKFLIRKAQIPKINIVGPQIKYRGQNINLAGDFKQEPLILTILADDKWKIRRFFEEWINHIYDFKENRKHQINSYRFGNELLIKQAANIRSDDIVTYKINDVVPLEISEIELDHGTSDTLEEFTVTFYYSTFEPEYTYRI